MKKNKKISELDETIITYIKKNRKFSRTKQIELKEQDQLNYIYNILESLNNINYIIFQDKIYRDHENRFLYTEDTYVFILNNNDLVDLIRKIEFNNYSYNNIILIENNNLIYLM
jgi:GTPase Era involved in 16S rRNA processing